MIKPADLETDVVTITPMRRRHLRSVLRIDGYSEHHGWSLGLYLRELSAPTGRVYRVAKVANTVVGFGGLILVGGDAHVTTIAVHPDWQRRSIATRVMLGLVRPAIEAGADALTLEVRTTNEAAVGLYRRFAMAPAGVRKNYYAELGEDALVMWANDIDGADYARRLDELEASLPGETRIEGMTHGR